MKRKVFLFLALFTLVPGLWALSACSAPDSPVITVPEAAIIDQLNPTRPDPDFIARTTAILKNNGFKVDYFSGEQVTLDLYRHLPAQGYSLIIFRAHSGRLGNGSKTDQKTCIFSNQPFGQMSELTDHLFNRVVKASVDNGPPLFGIGEDFVNHSLKGQFTNTTVIMMGCSSLEKDDLARAFINQGASAYIGWNESVGLDYVEDATLTLLEQLSRNDVSVESAVTAAMQVNGPDAVSGAELKYFPAQGGEAALSELLK